MDAKKPWAGEFVVDRAEDLDDAAREILVDNIRAGQTPAREIVTVGWDGASKPILRFRDQLDWPDHLRSRPDYLAIEAWKRAKSRAA